MNWTIEQLRAFVTSAEEGSFSAAGRALGKAQSVVSTHIAMLEDSLGVELFDRSMRTPTLTEAGQGLLPEARAVLRQSLRFDACAMAQYQNDAVELNIVLEHGVPVQGLTESIADLSARYPFLRGSFRIIPRDSVWSEVNDGKAHVGLVHGAFPPVPGGCEMVCLGQMRYCVVASAASPLAKLKKVSIQDLAQYRQIVLEDSETRFFELNAQSWKVNDMLLAVYWASIGIGWTAIPYGLARGLIEERMISTLVILDMKEVDYFESNIFMVWKPAFVRQDILDLLRKGLVERYRSELASAQHRF